MPPVPQPHYLPIPVALQIPTVPPLDVDVSVKGLGFSQAGTLVPPQMRDDADEVLQTLVWKPDLGEMDGPGEWVGHHAQASNGMGRPHKQPGNVYVVVIWVQWY